MIRSSKIVASALLSAAVLAAPVAGNMASAQDTSRPAAREHMWFADAYATAYYSLDARSHEIVARVEPGPKGGNPTVVRRTLADGDVERISIEGVDSNRLRATLIISRKADALSANVTTDRVPQRQASN